jgi:hypothetical protein
MIVCREKHCCERLYEEENVYVRVNATGGSRLRGSGASGGEGEFKWVRSAQVMAIAGEILSKSARGLTVPLMWL